MPGLTTILLPTYQFGERAARPIINWLASSAPPTHARRPIELIVRGTTARPCAAALQPTLA
jgi:LacI family transcriptional regulator